MKKIFIVIITLLLSISLTSCWENYSTGDRVGLVTEFSETGAFWKSWDGQLNLTQTGMNSSGVEPFDFSFDNDLTNQEEMIELVQSALEEGWKIKISFHQVYGLKNILRNRGESNYFVTKIEVLDTIPSLINKL